LCKIWRGCRDGFGILEIRAKKDKESRERDRGRRVRVPDPQRIALFSFGGEMVKAQEKKATPKKNTPRVSCKAKTAEEIQKVRNTVTNLILGRSEEMTERVVQSVIEGGQVAALKFLWEMSGLYPFEAAENEENDCLAKILLERMGLEGQVPVIATDDEGDVESEDELDKPQGNSD
jgi:hypothetical protein